MVAAFSSSLLNDQDGFAEVVRFVAEQFVVEDGEALTSPAQQRRAAEARVPLPRATDSDKEDEKEDEKEDDSSDEAEEAGAPKVKMGIHEVAKDKRVTVEDEQLYTWPFSMPPCERKPHEEGGSTSPFFWFAAEGATGQYADMFPAPTAPAGSVA
jgi:hypothetical protein